LALIIPGNNNNNKRQFVGIGLGLTNTGLGLATAGLDYKPAKYTDSKQHYLGISLVS